jgi:hypothetical protein
MKHFLKTYIEPILVTTFVLFIIGLIINFFCDWDVLKFTFGAFIGSAISQILVFIVENFYRVRHSLKLYFRKLFKTKNI